MNRSARTFLSAQPVRQAFEYRPEIDGLRAVAVSAVIANHFSNGALPGGFLGVDIFFVISGYVITSSMARYPAANIPDLLLGFYSRRIKRLVPALVICVAVTCLLGALFISPELSEQSHSMTAGLLSLLGLSNIYFFNESTDYFGASAALNLFTQTWSLGVEEQFYLVFPALFLVTGAASPSARGRTAFFSVVGFLTVLSFAWYLRLNKIAPNEAYFLMPPRFWELSIGCLCATAAHPRFRADAGGRFSYAPWLAAFLIAAALIAPGIRQLYTTPAVVIGTAVLIMTLRPGHLLFQWLTRRGIVFIGLMSYSLYLWHWSVLSISRWTVGVHWWSAPIQLALMLAVAAASYRLIERPLRRAQWSPSRFVTIGFGIAAVLCSAAAIFLLERQFSGGFYLGTPARLEAKGVETLGSDKWRAGQLQWRPGDCVLSSNDQVGKQIDAGLCALQGPPTPASLRHLLVIGDSFAVAEFEMYSAFSDGRIGSVIVTSSWGASPVPEIPNKNAWAKANDYYWGSAVPQLISSLSDGDLVLMVDDLQEMTPASMRAEDRNNLVLLKGGLNRLAADLRQRRIQVIFQASNPFIRDASCSPDMAKPEWFNLGRSAGCTYYSRAYSLQRRGPLMEVLQQVADANPNFHILDLYPVLCPDEVCRFYDSHGVFLYRDVFSHPSIEANRLNGPILLSAVKGAIAAADKMSQQEAR